MAYITPLINFPAAAALLTTLRAASTPRVAFVNAADRFCALLAEAALAVYALPTTVATPTGSSASGLAQPDPEALAAVSIVRSGDALAAAFARLEPAMSWGGKILVQRDEALPDKPPRFLLRKLPSTIATARVVFLCDPMLATGGSACLAVEELLKAGVAEAAVCFVCLVAAPEGLARLRGRHPALTIVVGWVDERLNEEKFIVPGLGDFGDRYFGTTEISGVSVVGSEGSEDSHGGGAAPAHPQHSHRKRA
jgi:uracil phosphoribosyltransferase